MSKPVVPRTPDQAAAAADEAQRAGTAGVGADLMRRYNRDEADPSRKAQLGHEVSRGYEFCIEPGDGEVYEVTVQRRMGL